MVKQIVMQVVGGNFETGFDVSVQISDLGRKKGGQIQACFLGNLPADEHLISTYHKWQISYYSSPTIRSAGIRNPRISSVSGEAISQTEYVQSVNDLEMKMSQWLNSPEILNILVHIVGFVGINEPARLIISTDVADLQRLPWQTWRLLQDRPLMGFSFSSASFNN